MKYEERILSVNKILQFTILLFDKFPPIRFNRLKIDNEVFEFDVCYDIGKRLAIKSNHPEEYFKDKTVEFVLV